MLLFQHLTTLEMGCEGRYPDRPRGLARVVTRSVSDLS
jgi:hypothetical protein